MSKWINLLWPSFAAAILGEIFFFAFIDPKELYLFGEPVHWSPIAVYSVGFFMFWALTALTTVFSHFFGKPADEINAPIESRPGAAPHLSSPSVATRGGARRMNASGHGA